MVALLGDVLQRAGRPRAAKIMHDIPDYHTTPVEAARIANEAHAKLLVFTHINPPLLFPLIADPAFLAGVSDVRPKGWVLGYDGLLIRLPGHSDAIEQSGID
jgi:ribonuclease Z